MYWTQQDNSKSYWGFIKCFPSVFSRKHRLFQTKCDMHCTSHSNSSCHFCWQMTRSQFGCDFCSFWKCNRPQGHWFILTSCVRMLWTFSQLHFLYECFVYWLWVYKAAFTVDSKGLVSTESSTYSYPGKFWFNFFFYSTKKFVWDWKGDSQKLIKWVPI